MFLQQFVWYIDFGLKRQTLTLTYNFGIWLARLQKVQNNKGHSESDIVCGKSEL